MEIEMFKKQLRNKEGSDGSCFHSLTGHGLYVWRANKQKKSRAIASPRVPACRAGVFRREKQTTAPPPPAPSCRRATTTLLSAIDVPILDRAYKWGDVICSFVSASFHLA